MRTLSWGFGLLLLLAAGCGGDGGSSTPRSFVGSYSGQWQSEVWGGSGPMNLTVASDGTAEGVIERTGTQGNATLAGTVTSDGTLVGQLEFLVGTPHRLEGVLQRQSDGTILSTVDRTDETGFTAPMTFFLQEDD